MSPRPRARGRGWGGGGGRARDLRQEAALQQERQKEDGGGEQAELRKDVQERSLLACGQPAERHQPRRQDARGEGAAGGTGQAQPGEE